MKAIRIHAPAGPEGLVYEDIPAPEPREGEVLVRVHATGITPMELSWQTSSGAVRPLPIIPGHELSGIVTQVGPGVTEVAVGDAVYALTDFSRDGAEAEYPIALPSEPAAFRGTAGLRARTERSSTWQDRSECGEWRRIR